MTNVRIIMCHAEFACERCGNLYTTVALAPWVDGPGVTGDAERIGREICNDCDRADRDAEREAYNKSRRQAAWARRAAKLAGKGRTT